MELNIQIKNNLNTINFSEIKLFMELYHLLNHIYFYYSNISIFCNEKNILFNQQLFFNLNNVSIVNIKYNKNCFIYKNIDDLIKNIHLNKNIDDLIKNIHFNNELNRFHMLRNTIEENYYYIQLNKKINKYVFCYNTNNSKFIHYFGNIYIFNPINNFYGKDHSNHNIWIDLNVKNLFQYLGIMIHAEELHIYDIDILQFILFYDDLFNHIHNKYLYIDNKNIDIYVKKDEPKLKNWKTIMIT
jgi:hypothetical protein